MADGGAGVIRVRLLVLLKGGEDLESNEGVNGRYMDEQQDTDSNTNGRFRSLRSSD